MILTPRRLFLAFGILSALAVMLFRVQVLAYDRGRELEQRASQAQALSEAAAAYTARLYDTSARLGRDIADFIQTERPSPDRLRAFIKERADATSADDYVVVIDADGRVVALSEGEAPAGPAYAASMQAYSRQPLRQVQTVLRSQITGSAIYSTTQRLETADGRFAGVIGVNVRPQGVRAPHERRPSDPLLSVWDREGRFVAASFVDFDKAGAAIPPPKPAGVGVFGAPADRDRLEIAASTPVEGWPLLAVASYDTKGVLGPWRRDLWENVALVALVWLVIGAFVGLGVRTARREERAIKDRELLLQEVHHRVKNSLAVTSSLIHLQSRQIADQGVREGLENTRQRLASIGLVHEVLYSGGDLAQVDFGTYLGRLVEELARAHGADARGVLVELETVGVKLSPDQATPVGLIVAEVLTNAFKHAFGPSGGGRILVRAEQVGGEVHITVSDDGVGYKPGKKPQAGSGLGSRLIESLAAQLGGRVSLSSDAGAVFRLCFPHEEPRRGPLKALKTRGRGEH